MCRRIAVCVFLLLLFAVSGCGAIQDRLGTINKRQLKEMVLPPVKVYINGEKHSFKGE